MIEWRSHVDTAQTCSFTFFMTYKEKKTEFFQVCGGSAICSPGTFLGLFMWCHLLDICRNNQARQRAALLTFVLLFKHSGDLYSQIDCVLIVYSEIPLVDLA